MSWSTRRWENAPAWGYRCNASSARLIIRVWRYIHIPLACLAVLVISYHSLIELWKWIVQHY